MHELKETPRLRDYEVRLHLENQVARLLHSHFTEGGNTKWGRRDEVKADVEALIAKYWPDYGRTLQEEQEYKDAINSW